MLTGETPEVPAMPIGLFPATQARVRALMETADEAILAGFGELADRLVSQARREVHTLRAQIGGLAA